MVVEKIFFNSWNIIREIVWKQVISTDYWIESRNNIVDVVLFVFDLEMGIWKGGSFVNNFETAFLRAFLLLDVNHKL